MTQSSLGLGCNQSQTVFSWYNTLSPYRRTLDRYISIWRKGQVWIKKKRKYLEAFSKDIVIYSIESDEAWIIVYL